MADIPGILKDKNGNILQPQTSFEKVIDADDSKSLKTWRTEVDAVLPTTQQKAYLDKAGQADGVALLGADGRISADKLPAVLSKFKGGFADEAALPSTGEEGDYAICHDTDTVWVWDAQADTGNGDWVDTGKKGSVTSVNSKTGDVEITLTDLGVTLQATEINDLPTQIQAADTKGQQGITDAAAAKTAADDAQADATQALADAAAAQGDATQALTDAATAQTEAEKVDFAVVDNGAGAPATLRDGGIYFEKD